MATQLNGSVKWIGLAIVLIGMVYTFGQQSKAFEKNDEANAIAITALQQQHKEDMQIVREDLKEIKADVKKILSMP